MRELSPKIVIYSTFICVILIFSGACIADPVDLDKFLEDDKVQDIIEKSKGSVIKHNQSDANIVAGNSKFTGLKADKYYIIEEFDEDSNTKGIRFVRGNGAVTDDLGLIAYVPGKEITGLTNDVTYKVNEVKPPANASLPYFDLISGNLPGSISNNVLVNSGVVTLAAPGDQYYLDIAPAGITVDKNYQIMIIKKSPAETPWDADSRTSARYSAGAGNDLTAWDYNLFVSDKTAGIYQFTDNPAPPVAYLQNKSLIKLEGADTAADYIIAEYSAAGVVSVSTLNVVILGGTDLSFEISFTITDNKPALSPASINVSQASLISGTDFIISLTNSGDFDTGSIVWMYDGVYVQDNSLTLTAQDVYQHLVLGTHVFSVGGTINGVPYSANFNVVVVD